MSKSAVSRLVSDLETELNVRLFNRTTRSISLTEAGHAYFARSSEIVADIEDLHNSVRGLHRQPTGVLRVTSAITFGHTTLAPLIGEFLAKYPEISVHLDLTNRLVDIVEEGHDLSIRVGRPQSSSLICRKLAHAKRYVCASPAYLDRRGQPLMPSDLSSHACVVYLAPGSESRWHFTNSEGEQSVTVNSRLRVNSTEAATQAVRDGVGIGVLPDYAVHGLLASGEVQRLLTEYDVQGDHHIYAIYPHRGRLSTKVRVFIDYLAAALGKGR